MDDEDMGVIADMHDKQAARANKHPTCPECEDEGTDEDGNLCTFCYTPTGIRRAASGGQQ